MPWHPESNPHFGLPQNQDQHFQSPSPGVTAPLHLDQQNQPSSFPWFTPQRRQSHPNQPLGAPLQHTKKPKQQARLDRPTGPHGPLGQPPPPHPRHQDHHSPPHHFLPPVPQPTIKTRCFAGFWACFWAVVVLLGLVVLVVYFLIRPHKPQFDVSDVVLNAAYLAPDALLHADLAMQAKFTNPSKKAKVDFSYMVLDLYYGKTLIASQNLEPFSLPKGVYSLRVVHMVTSNQVQLPEADMERLKKELSYSSVAFEIKGVFRARTKLGSLLRYTYRLHADCTFTVNGPPTGVLTAKYCKMKG